MECTNGKNSLSFQGLCAFPHCGCVANPGRYSEETYLGNWYEDTVRNTLKREDFLRKRECEDLSIQRSQIMVDTLLKPVTLSSTTDGNLHYGDSIQIVAPGPDCCTAVKETPFKKMCQLSYLALSASVGPNEIDEKPWLDTDSTITVSPGLFPCVRNSFVLEHPDEVYKCKEFRGVINYGDVFRIRAMPTQQFTLYLHSAPAIKFHAAALHSAKPLVRFSDTKNPNTLWTCHSLEPREELRMPLGVPVPLKHRLILRHALSGINLSVESNYPTLTYFGCEYEVSVETKRDTAKRVSWENHWTFDTERGWPKPDREFEAKAKFAAAINADQVNKSAADEAAREEEEQQMAWGVPPEEMSLEECEERMRENLRNQAEWDCMIRKAIEEKCAPRQKRCPPAYPTILPTEPLVCLKDIPEKKVSFVEQRADAVKEEIERQVEKGLEDWRKKFYADTAIPGYVTVHDPRTSPQPFSHLHKLSENQAFYPNQKWNCGNTVCCYPRGPANGPPPEVCCETRPVCCEPCEPKVAYRQQ